MKDPYDQPYHDFIDPVTEFNHYLAQQLGHGRPAP